MLSSAVRPEPGGPRLVSDLRHWPFFPDRPGSPGSSIVGSLELNRFMVVPSAGVPVVLRAIELLGSGASCEAATDTLRAEGLAVDVRKLWEKLAAAGLVLDASGEPERRSGVIDASIFHIWGADLAGLGPFFRFLGQTAWSAIMVLAALLAVSVAVVVLRNGHAASDVFVRSLSRGEGIPGTLAGLLLFAACFLFHEMSHAICGAHFGLVPRRFETGLFLGAMPLFYLRIGGLYTLPPGRRIAVWSAGAFGNFFLAAAAFLAAVAVPGGAGVLLAHVASTSFLLGVFNLFPFLPTDGYFIFSTLLRQHNLRKYAWQTAFHPSKAAGSRRRRAVFAFYALAMLATITILIGSRLTRAVAGLASGQEGSAFRILTLLFFPCLLLWRASSRRKRGGTPELSGAGRKKSHIGSLSHESGK